MKPEVGKFYWVGWGLFDAHIAECLAVAENHKAVMQFKWREHATLVEHESILSEVNERDLPKHKRWWKFWK